MMAAIIEEREVVDWFSVIFAALGIFYLFSGIYEWAWLWKMSKGIHPDRFGRRNTRLLFIAFGVGMIGIGSSWMLQAAFSSGSPVFFVVGFVASGLLTAYLFQKREKQSIVAYVRNKVPHTEEM
jgi:hypothetical protein